VNIRVYVIEQSNELYETNSVDIVMREDGRTEKMRVSYMITPGQQIYLRANPTPMTPLSRTNRFYSNLATKALSEFLGFSPRYLAKAA
jgi:hypothetical protein